MLCVIYDVIVQCGMSHPSFRRPLAVPYVAVTGDMNVKVRMYVTTEVYPAIMYFDAVCLIVFVVELLVRFAICPSRRRFLCSFYNIVDLISTISLLALRIAESAQRRLWTDESALYAVYSLSALGVFRVLRLLKFARRYYGFNLLLLALRASAQQIVLLLLLMTIGTLVFSNLVYFAEFYQTSDAYPNIPMGFWWSVITMTTVGYGDVVPHSGWGYLVGALCAVAGMLCTGLPIPIISDNFNLLLNKARRQKVFNAMMQRRRQREATMMSVRQRAAPEVSGGDGSGSDAVEMAAIDYATAHVAAVRQASEVASGGPPGNRLIVVNPASRCRSASDAEPFFDVSLGFDF